MNNIIIKSVLSQSLPQATVEDMRKVKERFEQIGEVSAKCTLTFQRVYHEIDLLEFRSEIESKKIYSNLKKIPKR